MANRTLKQEQGNLKETYAAGDDRITIVKGKAKDIKEILSLLLE